MNKMQAYLNSTLICLIHNSQLFSQFATVAVNNVDVDDDNDKSFSVCLFFQYTFLLLI